MSPVIAKRYIFSFFILMSAVALHGLLIILFMSNISDSTGTRRLHTISTTLIEAPASRHKTAAFQATEQAKSGYKEKNSQTDASIQDEKQPNIPFNKIWLPHAPFYFHTDELTEKPQIRSPPIFSWFAGLSKDVQYTAILRLQINEQGTIDRVIVDESTFPETVQALIVENFRKVTFTPGKIEGKSVMSELKIEVTAK